MLKHLNKELIKPERVIILGVNGYVGGELNKSLLSSKVSVLGIDKEHIDLCQLGAYEKLEKQIENDDVLVLTSCKLPCDNYDTFLDNMEIMTNICKVIQHKKLSQVIYVSSESIYAYSNSGLTESSSTAPESLNGMMHLAREYLIQQACQNIPLAILRPTFLYGANALGEYSVINKYIKAASKSQAIEVFGKGEERFDHVYIKDMVEILKRCIFLKSQGKLNIATGKVTSYHDIAQAIQKTYNSPSTIEYIPRTESMAYNGYRSFRIHSCQAAFPDFRFKSIENGILDMLETEKEVDFVT